MATPPPVGLGRPSDCAETVAIRRSVGAQRRWSSQVSTNSLTALSFLSLFHNTFPSPVSSVAPADDCHGVRREFSTRNATSKTRAPTGGHGGRHGRVRRVNKESRAAVRKKGVVFVAVAVWCSVDPRRPISPRGRRLDGSPFREQFGGRKRGRPGSSSSSRASRSIFRRWPLRLASLCFGLVPMALVLRFFGSTNSMKREENLPWNDPVRQQFHLFTTQRPPPESIRVNL